jgi:hypothetical protein
MGELQSAKSLRSMGSSWHRNSATKLSGVQHSDIAVRAGNEAEPFDRNSADKAAGESSVHLGTDTDGSCSAPHETGANNAVSKATARERRVDMGTGWGG